LFSYRIGLAFGCKTDTGTHLHDDTTAAECRFFDTVMKTYDFNKSYLERLLLESTLCTIIYIHGSTRNGWKHKLGMFFIGSSFAYDRQGILVTSSKFGTDMRSWSRY